MLLQPHGLHHCEQDFARQESPGLPVLREKEVNVERHNAIIAKRWRLESWRVSLLLYPGLPSLKVTR